MVQDRQAVIRKLGELIKDIEFAMFTTVAADGSLRSRPMATQKQDFDGALWFFTRRDSAKVEEVQNEMRANVAYADPDDQRYVSVSGTAQLINDHKKMEELWNPIYKAWFPQGLNDPQIALLRVNVESAEYWDSPNGKMVQLIGFVKAIVTGEQYHPGENEKLDLHRGEQVA